MFHCTVHQKGPSSRYKLCAVAVRHYVYSFGGYSDRNNMDHIGVKIFNTVSLQWRKLPPVTNRIGGRPLEVPSSRIGHTAVLIGDVAYIWGGAGGRRWSDISCNFLYGFDVDTHSWFRPKMYGTVPEARYFHSACALGSVMYIYGGYCSRRTRIYNDMYKLDTTTMVWTLINTVGTAFACCLHSATLIETKIFVHSPYTTEMRVFDTETETWLRTPSAQLYPESRWGHSDFAYNGELYIFGGNNGNQDLNDLWKYNPETFSWKNVEPKGKSPYQMNDMCCCMVGDRIIIFGGHHGTKRQTPLDDLFILDLNPSLKSLCKLAVIHYSLEKSRLPHNIMWELERAI